MLRIQMILAGMLLGAIWLPLFCQSEQTGWNPLPRAMVMRESTSATRRWQNGKNYAEVRRPSDILPSRKSLETNYQYGVNSGERGNREGGRGSDNQQHEARGGSDFVTSGYRYSYTTGGESTHYRTTPPMNNIREYANGFSYENPYNHGGTTAQPPTFEFGNGHAAKPNAEMPKNYNEAKPNDGRNGFDVKPILPNGNQGAKLNGNNGLNGFEINPNAGNVYDTKTNNHNGYNLKYNVNNGNVAKPNGFQANPSVSNGFDPKPSVSNAFRNKPNAPNTFNLKPSGPNGYDAKPTIYNPILPTVRPLFYGDFRGSHAQKDTQGSNKDYDEQLDQRDPDYNGEDFNDDNNDHNDDNNDNNDNNDHNDDNNNNNNNNDDDVDYDPKSHESEEIFNDDGNDNYIDGEAEPDKPQFRPNDKPPPFIPNDNDKPAFRPNDDKPPFRPNIMPHQEQPPSPLKPHVPRPPTFPTNRPPPTDYFESPKHVGHIIPLFTPSSSPQPHLPHESLRDHRPPSHIVTNHPRPTDMQLTPLPLPRPHPSQTPPLPPPPRAPEAHQHHEEPYMHLFQGPTPSNNVHRKPHNSNNDHREPLNPHNEHHQDSEQPNFRNPPSEQQHQNQNQNQYQENLQDPNGIDDSFFMLAMKVVHNTLFYGDMSHRNPDSRN